MQKAEIKKIIAPESWESNGTPSLILDTLGQNIELPLTHEPFDIEHAIKEWREAFTKYGIVMDKKGKEKFELWRAMVDVEGYICHVESKRTNIRRFLQAVDLYAQSHTALSGIMSRVRKPQESCLIYANPGAGRLPLLKKWRDQQASIHLL